MQYLNDTVSEQLGWRRILVPPTYGASSINDFLENRHSIPPGSLLQWPRNNLVQALDAIVMLSNTPISPGDESTTIKLHDTTGTLTVHVPEDEVLTYRESLTRHELVTAPRVEMVLLNYERESDYVELYAAYRRESPAGVKRALPFGLAFCPSY